MATGGGSLDESQKVIGSEEVYDLECQPCCQDGKSAEAVGMCITCQDYLCQPCFDIHNLPKHMRGHKLVKKDQLMKSQIPLDSKDECTEICRHHKDKVIEYHCVNHDLLGCPTCIINDHRACDVTHIPKVVQNLDNNALYQEVEAALLEMEQTSQNIDTLSTQRATTLDTGASSAIEKIQNQKQEIIQKLDKIEAELKQKVTSIKSEEMDKVMKLTDQCKQAQTDLGQMIRKVQGLKSGKHRCDLYMYMANIKSQLQPLSNQLADVEHKITTTHHHISFNPNIETVETLKTIEAFGNVTSEKCQINVKINVGMKVKDHFPYTSIPLSTEKVSPNIPVQSETVSTFTKQKCYKVVEKPFGPVSMPIEKLSHVKDITVKTNIDKKTCRITGLALLPGHRLALADNGNLMIKIVDVQTGQVTSQLSVYMPWDIVLIESAQIAVTFPEEQKIAFVNLAATPTVDRYLDVNGLCSGMDYREGKLTVAYYDKVEVFNLQGTILHTINTTHSILYHYIAFSQDNQRVYISDVKENKVKCYSLEGKLLSTYTDDQLQRPRKVITDSSGNVYICDFITHTVHQLSSDLRKIKILLNKDDGLFRPLSICYNECKGDFYVGSFQNDKVKVYKAVN